MAIFQNSVLKKYLSNLDVSTINEQYTLQRQYFGNPEIQENIRNSKEEQFQEGFLRELFVKILGYTLNPDPKFNLTTELKNISNSKKTDGAILDTEGNAIAVIELKSTNTTDLDSVELQAFGYKNHHPKCKYVITSNFEKIRFYIEDAVEYIEFDLFNLSKDQFFILWLCIAKDTLLRNLPLEIKSNSITQEKDISKRFYSDYSSFRTAVFENLIKKNPEKDKFILFKKTQKLLDRFLFIFFGEDRLLLPPNSIRIIIDQWETLREMDEYIPLYSRFKKYFDYMDKGHKGKKHEIFAYNGGLFKPDDLLDSIIIDDDILFDHTQKLSSYNFDTDVDVNILGHIFEQSLVDIESIHAEINGVETPKKSKRKKDGIFYTPKYVTKYIVEQTIGTLCKKKRQELEIIDEEYAKERKNRRKTTIISLNRKLQDYRGWLLTLTILDPACGSGAFLTEALGFLILEHQKIDELRAQLYGDTLILSDITEEILENNIYGVDINEESIEIAKLSLWLRTAQRGRKLSSLSDNIKCGNSLISNEEIAKAKAFDWTNQFEEVFKKGGFDVVIGNPPYGAELPEEYRPYLEREYRTFEYQVNSYVLFYEKGMELLKENGMLGYITPATFTYQHYFRKLRQHLQQYQHFGITKYFYEVFEDAGIGDAITWIMRKAPNLKSDILLHLCKTEQDALTFPVEKAYSSVVNEKDGLYLLAETGLELSRLMDSFPSLGELSEIIVGVKAYQKGKGVPKQTAEIVKNKIFTADKKIDDTYKQCIIGKDFHRYHFLHEPSMYLSYGEWLAEPRMTAPFFDEEKIILRQTADSLIATIDNKQRINLNNVYNVGRLNEKIRIKFVLGLLNSKLLNTIYQSIAQEKGRMFAEVKKVNLSKLPICIASSEIQEEISSHVESIMSHYTEIQLIISSFTKLVKTKFSIDKVSRKISDWYLYDFNTFISELIANKVKLNLSEETEWLHHFEVEKQKIDELNNTTKNIISLIDMTVYNIYSISEDEISIIENL